MVVMYIDVPAFKVVEEVKLRWCYAAVEQVLRKAFGKPDISQTEIAHNCFLRVAKKSTTTHGDLGRMLLYAKKAVAQLGDGTVAGVDEQWLQIRDTLQDMVVFGELDLDKDGLRALLRECWGEFDRKIFTTVNLTCPPSVFEVTGEIDDRKLVAAANDVHWYVIYGYDYDSESTAADEESKYTYLVYDVHDGSAQRMGAVDFNKTLSEVLGIAA